MTLVATSSQVIPTLLTSSATSGQNLKVIIFHFSCVYLAGSGIAPSPRAAHGSCSVDSLQMVVYGGATGGGSLASDDLYLLDLRNGD